MKQMFQTKRSLQMAVFIFKLLKQGKSFVKIQSLYAGFLQFSPLGSFYLMTEGWRTLLISKFEMREILNHLKGLLQTFYHYSSIILCRMVKSVTQSFLINLLISIDLELCILLQNYIKKRLSTTIISLNRFRSETQQ